MSHYRNRSSAPGSLIAGMMPPRDGGSPSLSAAHNIQRAWACIRSADILRRAGKKVRCNSN